MKPHKTNKRKILNDPVYGFISLRHDIIHDLIDHPWFQRLRRISQLGLSHLVYPGAVHNRFHHAIGAMHLMHHAVDEIRLKGHEITDEEALGVTIAILLHDIGHGPYSHALEHSLVNEVNHEDISAIIMNRLNDEFGGQLDTAIEIFNDHYPKRFLHQLVSSQLDMDRLDYLRRDSFYSGVTEGQISSERIIKMLNVVDDQLVVDEKGIYSIEKFIVARRLMYWQVYLHKTVISAEFMLVKILQRAKYLARNKWELYCSNALHTFLYNEFGKEDFNGESEVLERYAELDDYDIMGAIKVWVSSKDRVLSILCQKLVSRDLFKTQISKTPFSHEMKHEILDHIAKSLGLSEDEKQYFLIDEKIDNKAYSSAADSILIRFKDGSLKDAASASDHLNLHALSQKVEKHFLCYPHVE